MTDRSFIGSDWCDLCLNGGSLLGLKAKPSSRLVKS